MRFGAAAVSLLLHRDAWGSERLRSWLRAAQLADGEALAPELFSLALWPLEAETEMSLRLHFQLRRVLVQLPSERHGCARDRPATAAVA